MQPHKTELGHAELHTPSGALDLRQRRALILCDGKRDLDELRLLLGSDAATLIAGLQREGYLATDRPAPAEPHRRSLLAARIYVLDILALQRHPTATQLHRVLQAAREDADTVQALTLALRHLPTLTSEGYTQRVQARLREVLPQAQLAAVLEPAPLPA
ncbi:hypothetical protein ARC78_09680 [Stenotrophomonas pictorum JCM 9942]|uniref:Uncharacterized protein n=1 Tax=Stenotrophomonas pictorum JCM 9942 TaxID=1236960 RepID=A0A0R0ABK0_9GAMM|nr:hypothetical protein [Stenotrophomonas pictorum]KRG42207.1 hypothetical protein ARC78_09680 [Stenotrophomonas pictorum JCM 9942]